MEIMVNQAITAYQEGRLDEAEASYKKIIELKPDYVEAHYNLGVVLYRLGKFDEAEASYRKVIELKPYYIEAHNNLGGALKKLGRLDEAVASYKKIIELKPDYVEAHYNLGVVLRDLGKFNEAMASYKKIIALKPDYVEAHYNLGIVLYRLGKFDEAIVSFDKAIELKPDFVEAHYNLSITLYDIGRLNEAEAGYRKAIELKPDYADAYNNLGAVLKDLNKLNEAEASYRKVIELKPDTAEIYDNLGLVLKSFGKLDEAEISFDKAIELDPDYKPALLNKSRCLFAKNKFELSLKYFDLCDNEQSRALALSSLYNLGRIEDIYKRIEKNYERDDKNLEVAAFSSFISKKEKKDTAHKFCNHPIDFIDISNLSSYLKNSNLFIKKVIEELKTIDTVWEDKTTRNGFHSINKMDIFKNPYETLKQLKSIISDEIDTYYSKFKNENCSYIKMWPSKKIISGWYVLLKKQGYQLPHFHPAGWLSGVIYLKVVPHLGKDEGAIKFSLNGWGYSDPDSSSMIYAPKEGDMVLFPSSLYHNTIPYSTNTDRIVISFDLMPKTRNPS